MTDTLAPQYVGFWPRFAAGCVDAALFTAVVELFPYVLAGLGTPQAVIEYVFMAKLALIHWMLALALLGLCWARFGGTPGLLLMGCQVVSERDGRPVSLKQAMIRSFALVPSFALMGVGVLWMAWDKRKQGWHDKYARTLVVPEGGYAPDDLGKMSLDKLIRDAR